MSDNNISIKQLTKAGVDFYPRTNVAAIVDFPDLGTAGGVATLDSNGKVPSQQLPSFVDDVLEYANLNAFPQTGEAGKIYVAQDTNKTYRWSGSDYVVISETISIGTTTGTAYPGEAGAQLAERVGTLENNAFSGDYDDLINKPTIPTVPTNVSTFNNDAGYLTSHQDISGKADKTDTVSTIAYDATNKKLTKTINGSTTDVVTAATIVTDGGAYVKPASGIPASDLASGVIPEGMDVLILTNSSGVLTNEQFDLIDSNHCVIKYNNRIYYKSYSGTGGIDYLPLITTRSDDSVVYPYFTASRENKDYLFADSTDNRPRVQANPTFASGVTPTLLETAYIAGHPYILPQVPSDVLIYGQQTLTAEQKAQARANIGAGTGSGTGNGNVGTSDTLTADTVVLGGGGTNIKASSYTISNDASSIANASQTTIPTAKAISDKFATLTGALVLAGTSSTAITDGGTEDPTIAGYSGTAKTTGNVVMYDGKEFVWNGSAWEQLGDEGSYALKTTTITAGSGLTGTGTLASNITLAHSNSVTAQTTQAIYPITIDAQGHIASYGTAAAIPAAVTVDANLDTTSSNPVQNSTVATVLNNKAALNNASQNITANSLTASDVIADTLTDNDQGLVYALPTSDTAQGADHVIATEDFVTDAIDDINSEVWTFTLTSDGSTVTKTVLLG